MKLIRSDIHEIRSLKQTPERKFNIAELAEISADISLVSSNLKNQEEYKRQWLRDLSHDLRTPLAGLKSQLEAMADGVLEPAPERFRRNLLEIERLEALAASIGELMSIEARETIEKGSIDAKRFAGMLTAPYELEVERRGIKLDVSVETGDLYAEESLLLRGIGNILSNAFKYIEDGGLIQINISDGKIEILNDGPDIPPDQLELIFTRLFPGRFRPYNTWKRTRAFHYARDYQAARRRGSCRKNAASRSAFYCKSALRQIDPEYSDNIIFYLLSV